MDKSQKPSVLELVRQAGMLRPRDLDQYGMVDDRQYDGSFFCLGRKLLYCHFLLQKNVLAGAVLFWFSVKGVFGSLQTTQTALFYP